MGRPWSPAWTASSSPARSHTAELFRSWKPDLRLFAETSGKNAMVITPNADLDLAVADLVRLGVRARRAEVLGRQPGDLSSATVYDSPRGSVASSRDAVETPRRRPGPPIADDDHRAASSGARRRPRSRALTTPRPGRVVAGRAPPARRGAHLDAGRAARRGGGSWFHRTECFGPVLGLMRAERPRRGHRHPERHRLRAHRRAPRRSTPTRSSTGSTRVEVGNAYVNRAHHRRHRAAPAVRGVEGIRGGPGRQGRRTGLRGPARTVALHLRTSHRRRLALALPGRRRRAVVVDGLLLAWPRPHGLVLRGERLRYRPLPAVAMRVGPAPTGSRRTGAVGRSELRHPADRVVGATGARRDLRARLDWLGVGRVRVVGDVGGEIRRAAASVSCT